MLTFTRRHYTVTLVQFRKINLMNFNLPSFSFHKSIHALLLVGSFHVVIISQNIVHILIFHHRATRLPVPLICLTSIIIAHLWTTILLLSISAFITTYHCQTSHTSERSIKVTVTACITSAPAEFQSVTSQCVITFASRSGKLHNPCIRIKMA